ncbi:MAG: hypothetical protein NT062_17645, partial [Proteobacteria bacterium]|nr:hypothetical protein [Pseudomonadota bacterium]
MLLPFGAAILQLAFGIIFLAISRARGWARARLFAVLALTASLYAFADIAYTLPHVDLKVLVVVVRLNYLLASIHCAAWLVYAFGAGEWRRLSRRLHALIGVTVLAASIGQIPGVLDAGGSDVLKVPPYGAYLVPRVTWFAEIFGVWLL